MINAAMTLLINLDGGGVDLTPFGQYVDPLYRAVPLPGPLAAVAAAIYNNSSDRTLRNYFALLYLTVLEAGDYADHLRMLDPRITYLPLDTSETPGFGVAASPIANDYTLYLSGPAVASPGSPVMLQSWTVAVTGEYQLSIQDGSGAVTAATLTFTNGLSQQVPLPGSPISASIQQGLPIGTAWTVESLLQPAEGLPQIFARLEGLHPDSLVALFGINPAEPLLSYSNLWGADQLQDRVTGVLLALIYQTAVLAGLA